VDAWNQSAAQPVKITGDIERRMDWVFRRAAGTMAVTSLTTAAAFLSNVFSSLLPIKMFGIFMVRP
jgi:predicted RND superfamily exporter protein